MIDTLLVHLKSSVDAQIFGNKAAHLSEALCAGLTVPQGYAVHPDLVSHIAQNVFPKAEYAAMERILAPLVVKPVVVRSSAIGEDGVSASFAGQYTTFLNVHGFDEILTAIKRIWASGQKENIEWYRTRMGIGGKPRIASIVQALVPTKVAGVLFTIDPVSGSDDRWIVEASWGLGEAVVAGLVIPDRYIISRAGALLEMHLGRKDVAIVPDESGGTKISGVEDSVRVWDACLKKEELIRLAELGLACERLFGKGQDIEWAFSSDSLYLLQCRPVTGRTV